MRVFKVYLKIFYKNIVSIVITFVAFVIICLLFIRSNPKETYGFQPTKTYVTVINKDADTDLLNGLKKYLDNFAYFRNVEEKNIEDALYYREIYIALIIPEGFTAKFLAGEEVSLIEKSVPDAAHTVATKRAINKYLHTVKVYLNNTDETVSEVIPAVIDDLKKSIEIEKTVQEANAPVEVAFYYNYLTYLFVSVIFTVIGTVMIVFRQKHLRQRIDVSPLSQAKLNAQLILSHLFLGLIVFAIMCGLSFILYPRSMLSIRGVLFVLNAFCVTLAIGAMGYAFSLYIKTRNVLGAFTNVFALGTCFICGAFVPQDLLSKGMLTFARVFPNYYYVVNNNRIGFLTELTSDSLTKIFINMLIQLLFALAFMIASIFISKKQMTSEN